MIRRAEMGTEDTDDAPPEPPAAEGPPSQPGARGLFDDEEPTGDSRIRSAADDPTAVWEEDSLQQVGFSEVAGIEGGPERGPATNPDDATSRPSIEISDDLLPVAGTTERPRDAGGLSWSATIVLALGLGALVFTIFYSLR